jgi:response regulator of citrate/malate metabolism
MRILDKIKVAIAEDDFRIADIHEKFLEKFKEIDVAIIRAENPRLTASRCIYAGYARF